MVSSALIVKRSTGQAIATIWTAPRGGVLLEIFWTEAQKILVGEINQHKKDGPEEPNHRVFLFSPKDLMNLVRLGKSPASPHQ